MSTARISWDDDTPMSEQFQDIYFSRANGLDEKRYVFLEQNQLPQRWQDFSETYVFTIVETGFGTGLNFLTTWLLWSQCAEPKPRLAFVSVEKFPISRPDLEQCLSIWPELSDFTKQLLDVYPALIQGNHQLIFEQGRIQLNLLIGDVNGDLGRHPFSADCWFLDGFTPSKNADMWHETLFRLMQRRSRPDATFATSTAAGFIGRALAANGFDVERIKGFGPKKKMLRGRFQKPSMVEFFPDTLTSWAYPSSHNRLIKHGDENIDVIIIGAGLAGITTAHTLACSGLKVLILEHNDRPMTGASGQSQLALYAKLPGIHNKESRFLTQCLLFSQRHFRELQACYPEVSFWHPSGLLQLAWNENEQRRLKALLTNTSYPDNFIRPVDATEAYRLCGIHVDVPGLWFDQSGWLDPHSYAKALLSHPRITLRCNTPCTSLYRQNDDSWVVTTPNHDFSGHCVVVASAYDTSVIQSLAHFPLKTLRGQVTTIQSESLINARSVVCGEGYLCPPHNGEHNFGATYDLISKHDRVISEDNQLNIANIQQWLPDWLTPSTLSLNNKIKGSAGLRCTTPDYFPIAGQIHNSQTMTTNFAPLRHNANACKNLLGDYHFGLFINIGHGSKGLTTIPSCAEWISAQITGKPGMFNDEAISAINPARFLIKNLIKRKV